MNRNVIKHEVHQNDFKTLQLTDCNIITDPILTRAVVICSKLVRFIETEHIFCSLKIGQLGSRLVSKSVHLLISLLNYF